MIYVGYFREELCQGQKNVEECVLFPIEVIGTEGAGHSSLAGFLKNKGSLEKDYLFILF